MGDTGEDQGDDVGATLLARGAGLGLQLTTTEEDPALHFFELVRQVVLQSIDGSKQQLTGEPAVFVMAQRPREESAFLDATHLPDVDLGEANRWLGRIIVAAAHGRSGFSSPLTGGTVEASLAQIAASPLATQPLAIFYPEHRMLSCYRTGALDEGPRRFHLPSGTKPVTVAEILKAMEDYHSESLLSPGVGSPHLWAKASDYWAGDQLEKELQWGLVIELRSTFRPIKVEPEQNSPAGRVDILFTDPHRNQPLHPATIEVKALRSRRSSGSPVSAPVTIKHVEDGYSQAAGYRAKYGAAIGFLACFDLRKKKTNILNNSKIRAARKKYFTTQMYDVIFPLFGTASEAQKYLAIKAKACEGGSC